MKLRVSIIDLMTAAVLVLAVIITFADGSPARRQIAQWQKDKRQSSAVSAAWGELVEVASPLGGQVNRDVSVIMISDYECPFCKTAEASVDSALKAGVGISLLHFPIASHKSARAAALVALCAEQQNIFSDVRRSLFGSQDWREESGASFEAIQLLLSGMTSLKDCPSVGALEAKLRKHTALAERVLADATPTFLTRSGVLRPKNGQSLAALLISTDSSSKSSTR